MNEKAKQAAIVKIDNYKSTVKIPANVDGYKVVQIGTDNYDWSHVNFKPTYALDERKVDVRYKVYEKRTGNNKLIKNVKESAVSFKQKKTYIVEAIYSYKDI